jgi:DNA-binding response OmpR family regulator
MSSSTLGHVILAGKTVGTDRRLIAQVGKTHIVTVAEDPALIPDDPLLARAQLMVLDCCDNEELCLNLIKRLNPRASRLLIVLVDGGLEQGQIAEAFASGIIDYFAAPYNIRLLVERINALCSRSNHERNRERANGAEILRQAERR